VVLDTARVQVEHSRDHYYIETIKNQRFSLFATPGTKQNNQVVAELMDDHRTTTGGLIKYAGVEVKKGKAKQGYEVVGERYCGFPKKPTRLIKIFRCCWWKMVNM